MDNQTNQNPEPGFYVEETTLSKLKKYWFSLFTLVILLGGVALTTIVAQQQQEIRQRAEGPVTSPGKICLQVVTYAIDPATRECKTFNNSCIPDGFEKVSSCTGLKGEYFNNIDHTGSPSAKRVDTQINFDWDKTPPPSPIQPNNFSVIWTGQVMATISGTYFFAFRADDGVRLSINNQLIIAKWGHRNNTEDLISKPVYLLAKTKYLIKIEYLEEKRLATPNINHVAKLKWRKPGQTIFENISSTNLYVSYPISAPTSAYRIITPTPTYSIWPSSITPTPKI